VSRGTRGVPDGYPSTPGGDRRRTGNVEYPSRKNEENDAFWRDGGRATAASVLIKCAPLMQDRTRSTCSTSAHCSAMIGP
jgi:hypothetical protein